VNTLAFLFIERIGFPNKFPVKRQGRSPFSDKASLVLRALLSCGNQLWGIRELAQEIALDPGYVSRMARESSSGEAEMANRKIRLIFSFPVFYFRKNA
jgi:DNA-binding MarR family transcriptional regulator